MKPFEIHENKEHRTFYFTDIAGNGKKTGTSGNNRKQYTRKFSACKGVISQVNQTLKAAVARHANGLQMKFKTNDWQQFATDKTLSTSKRKGE